MADKVSTYFFSPRSGFNLAVCRILFYSFLIFIHFLAFKTWIEFPDFDEALFHPSGIFSVLGSHNFSKDTLSIIFWVSVASCSFSAIGLFSRVAMVVSFLTVSILNAQPQLYGTLVNLNPPIFFILAVFCFSRASDRLAVDNIFFKKTSRKIDERYDWPLKYICGIHILIIFVSSLYKIQESGFGWLLADHLKNEFLCSPFLRSDSGPDWAFPLGLNFWFANRSLTHIGSIIAFCIEFFSPLIFLKDKLKWVFLPGFFAIQVLSYLTLFIRPHFLLIFYIFWINWEFIFRQLTRPTSE